jgi:hypothetical protein
MDFGLPGGTDNLVLPESDGDNWESSSETESEESSGAESLAELVQNGGRRSVKRGASLVSLQSKKGGSGNSNDAKPRGSALGAEAPLGLIASVGRSPNRRRSTSPREPGETSNGNGNGNGPRTQSPENDEDKDLGVANRDFFRELGSGRLDCLD